MRNTEDVYWGNNLPKDHQALQTLDAYCQEWGGLSRAEATLRMHNPAISFSPAVDRPIVPSASVVHQSKLSAKQSGDWCDVMHS